MEKSILRVRFSGLFVLYLILAAFNLQSEKQKTENFIPLGKIYVVSGKQVHLYCLGNSLPGEPTVILEAGTGDNHMTWHGLQQDISRTVQVCSYDRLGYGWSDSSRGPRSVELIAGELFKLLKTAQIQPPYVLAGHSFGGLVMHYFAARYPETVLGLVLVDATPAATLLERQSGIRQPLLLVPPALTGLAALTQSAGLFQWAYENNLFPPFEALDPLPAQIRPQAEALYFRTRTLAASAVEQLYLGQSARLAVNLPLPDDLPVVAFISGLEGIAGMLPEIQAEFSSLTANSQVSILPNSHYLHLERPDLVQRAIETMVSAGQ